MSYAVNVDTNEGYWGDDDQTGKDGDGSELSDHSPASTHSSRSNLRVNNGSISTPLASRTQRSSTFKTPSRPTRNATQPSLLISPVPAFRGQSSASISPSPSHGYPTPSPNTPESRRRAIERACHKARERQSSPSISERHLPPISRTPSDNSYDYMDDEVPMIMTDTESQELSSESTPWTSWSLSLSHEQSFSSIRPRNPPVTPERKERMPAQSSRRLERTVSYPSPPLDSPAKPSGVLYTPAKTPSLPTRSESMPLIGTQSKIPTKSIYNMELATGLGVTIVAHDPDTQQLMDAAKLSWGVQYELARGVNKGVWSWSDVTPERLRQLKGTNAESAYKVANVMLGRRLDKAMDLSLWHELDREQEAIMENEGRGLGLMGPWKGEHEWFGGRIQQLARSYVEDGEFHIRLEPMEKRRSHRFARYCGSRRILQVRIPDDKLGEGTDLIRERLCHRFVLCGRVFVPFHAKEGTVYMVEIDDFSCRQLRRDCGDQFLMPFSTFVNWHNPLELNKSQPISKYASRFALGLSNSVPVIEFQSECIIFIQDETPASWDKSKKPPSDKILTDGCGFINRAAMMAIKSKMQYGTRPTAVQGRIGGAKGLWIVDPSLDRDDRPRIWIRDSQNKIKYPNLNDRSYRILELLCVSQTATTFSLSEQPILNLHFNGVPETTLAELLEQGIEEEVKPLMDWDLPLPCLWRAIAKTGSVPTSRAARFAVGRSRALGLTRQEWGPAWLNNEDVLLDENEDVDAMDVDDTVGGAYTGRDSHSGAPLGLHETAVELLQAGFIPTEFTPLRDKIRFVVETTIKSSLEKFHIPLKESISALVVPDPLGVLEDGQIYYKSSTGMIDHETATMFNVLTGQVLVGRFPVRLASDIQMVTAVDHPELSEWSDVIIVSIKGERSAANILSGGDYDGDELFIIRESCLVKPFQNKPLIPEPPALQRECFDVNVETVHQFSQRQLPDSDFQKKFQYELLAGLNDAKVGLYSMFHEYAGYKYGYNHSETVRMAYMFSTTLDSGKTGLRLKPDVFKKHKAKFCQKIPEDANYILRSLAAAGQKKSDEVLQKYDLLKKSDALSDLTAPWNRAMANARQLDERFKGVFWRKEMQMIRDHVEKVHQQWGIACSKSGRKKSDDQKKKRQRSARTAKEDPMRQVAAMFHEKLDVTLYDNVDILKASYACVTSPKFALSVAFNLVCQIKANASPNGVAPCTRIFDEMKSIAPVSLRAMLPPDSAASF
ncbi:RNA dependent RNA polymerase domain containing protein [Amanita muscaria]